MRRFTTATLLVGLVFTMGCPKVETAQQVDKAEESTKKPKVVPTTAMVLIRNTYKALETDCGQHLPEVKNAAELAKLELSESDQEEADRLLADIGLFAQQCSSYDAPEPRTEGCNQDCSWCPVKWYWCIENAGACAGGDHKACCKLGACGSKHHCEKVCKASCSCDVPPQSADG